MALRKKQKIEQLSHSSSAIGYKADLGVLAGVMDHWVIKSTPFLEHPRCCMSTETVKLFEESLTLGALNFMSPKDHRVYPGGKAPLIELPTQQSTQVFLG